MAAIQVAAFNPDCGIPDFVFDDAQKPKNNTKIVAEFLRDVNRQVNIASKVFGPARRVTAFARVFVSIPKNINVAIRGTKLLAGISGICALPPLLSAAQDIPCQVGVANKAQAIAWTVLAGAELVSHIAEFADALEHIGVLTEEQTAWTSAVRMAFMPLSLLSVGMGAYKVYKINEFRNDYQKFVKTKVEEQEVPTTTCELFASLSFICETNEKILHARLALGKKCKIKELAINILEKIQTSEKEEKKLALQEGEKLVENLKGRIKKKLAYEIVGIVIEIITIIAATIFFMTAATGAFALGTMALLSVSSLALYAYNKTALPRYPSFLT